MNDHRPVSMSEEQAEVLDQVVIPLLMRLGDEERAAKMMGLALAWKFAKKPEPAMPSNVVELHGHSRRVGA